MYADIQRVLIPHEQIQARVHELARQITDDLLREQPATSGGVGSTDGPELTIVPIMTGAMIFAADLIRQIPIAMRIGLLTVSSYPGAATTSKGSVLTTSQLPDLRGRHVLAVDDILDSGGTLRLVVPRLRDLGAVSVKSCVLLRKDREPARATPVDYVGFDIPDEFVVGYGLDYNNYYRNLPHIAILHPDAVERRKNG